MSGILLPGQDKKPKQPAGGLEIAGGFVKKKDAKPTEPPPSQPEAPAAETPAAPPPTAPAAPGARPQSGRRLSAEDFMFPPQAAQIQCPSCGTPYAVPIFSIIDFGANPELRQPLLAGQINFAQCPNCGMGGPLSAPLLVHSPEHQWLGAFIAAEARINDVQRQKVIGDLTQALMRKLPAEARKGYMLQPKQYSDWQTFSEKIWEFEGVTPEMLRRQREQSALLQNLIALANDRKALEIALQRNNGTALVDRTFFAMLDRMLVIASQQGQGEPFVQLRNNLLEMTEAGKQIKAQSDHIREVLGTVNEKTTREDLIDLLLRESEGENGRDMLGALAASLSSAFDYQFLLAVNERIEHTSDETAKQRLEEIRQMVLSIQEQQRASQQMVIQQVQQVLQEVLQAEDVDAKLQELAEYIDETFLAVLASNIQTANQRNSKAAANRLQEIYDKAVTMIEGQMPPEIRFINQLITADDRAEVNRLLQENRSMLTKEFVESLRTLENEMRQGRRNEIADRIKSLRGQIALMV
ncbi:MAG: CpXC domain-containing protein [Caldilineaceae bacterium]